MAEEEIIMEEEMLNISKLPQEIIAEILSWLPAKSLLSSFKFVCKSWCTLIHEPVFVKMHLNRVAIINGGGGSNNNSLICKSGRDLFQLYPPFNFDGEGEEGVITATNLYFPSLLTSFRFSGSCNGLLCINAKNNVCIVLVNPCTRKYKISLRHPIQLPPTFRTPRTVLYGFGCCYNNNSTDDNDNIIIEDYKVIRIVSFSNREYTSLLHHVDIYSMSSDSWRRETTRFKDYPYFISNQQSGVFVKGALHWMGYKNNNLVRPGGETYWDTIVSFHVRDEEFRLVPVPLSCEPTVDFHLHDIILMNMKGCLSMILFSPQGINNSMNVDLEIWVMKEYGIKESWIKEIVIRSSNSDPSAGELFGGFVTSRTSNAYVLKGDQILIEGMEQQIYPDQYCFREKQVLYDIDKRKIHEDFEMVGFPYQSSSINQVDYIETLVSLKSSLLPLSNN